MKMLTTPRVFLVLGTLACTLLSPSPSAAQYPTEPPPPMESERLEFPPFSELKLENGLDVAVVEDSRHPVASIYLLVKAGETSVPAEQAGLAGLLASTIDKGTAQRSADEIAREIEGIGSALNATATDDYVGIGISVLSQHVPLAFELLSDVALRPTFPEGEVETARARKLSELQASLGQPGTLADRQVLHELYGEHPYGRSATPTTVASLSASDLRRFHERNFKPGSALLVVAGDVSVESARELARHYFGGWARGSAPAPGIEVAPAASGADGIALINRPGSAQSVLRVAFPTVQPGHPDYYPLEVLTKILGGGTDARACSGYCVSRRDGHTGPTPVSSARPASAGSCSPPRSGPR